MKKWFLATFPLFVLCLPASATAEDIQYVGSSTVGQYIQAAAKEYAAATFHINTAPESGGGEMAISTGRADLGGVARDVKPEILAKGVKQFLIGKDAICALVHPENPVTELSLDQLRGIFSGRISNWNEVGGPDGAIDVYIVNPQSATRSVFQKVVMGTEGYGGKRISTIRPDSKIVSEVSANPLGIGQLSFSFLGDSNVKCISPDGQEASVNNPHYPITRNLHLITKGEPVGAVKNFISWTLSSEGQKIVKRFFIGINTEAIQ